MGERWQRLTVVENEWLFLEPAVAAGDSGGDVDDLLKRFDVVGGKVDRLAEVLEGFDKGGLGLDFGGYVQDEMNVGQGVGDPA